MELGSEGRYADMLIRSVLMRRVEQVGADATISPGGGCWVGVGKIRGVRMIRGVSRDEKRCVRSFVGKHE